MRLPHHHLSHRAAPTRPSLPSSPLLTPQLPQGPGQQGQFQSPTQRSSVQPSRQSSVRMQQLPQQQLPLGGLTGGTPSPSSLTPALSQVSTSSSPPAPPPFHSLIHTSTLTHPPSIHHTLTSQQPPQPSLCVSTSTLNPCRLTQCDLPPFLIV